MTNNEAIKKIKDICEGCKNEEGYVIEESCPFFDKEHVCCIFWAHGIAIPSEWSDDND